AGGIRMFKDKDFEWLFVIECLKKTGMPIKDIKSFIDMAVAGDETINERLDLIKKQRDSVLRQIKELQGTLDILNYKCWYYETAKTTGTTSVPRNMSIEEVPEELRDARRNLNRMHSNETD
ncbi:MAG: MerR family transcriptional regulator, partial [Hominilimicola sp.]